MRVLFQGAGAIGIAGAALFTEAHQVAVVSRFGGAQTRAAFPRRVSIFDPSTPGTREGESGKEEGEDGRRAAGYDRREGEDDRRAVGYDRREGESGGWSVTRLSSTRRVAITDWATAAAAGSWDLIVLTTRPGDLDSAVAQAIRDISPVFIAITSQVEGDLERARSVFPGTEVVVFGPAFLSKRLDAGTRTGSGREPESRHVRFWAPAGAPRFLVAGQPEAVRALARGLGRLVLPVPMEAVLLPPRIFIPFVAELSLRDGNWAGLKSHLDRPSKAAAEALRARLGMPVPVFGSVARAVLEALELIVPIDVTRYAGRHFARHVGQTRDMLAGWAESTASARAMRELIAALDAGAGDFADA